jgi:hypothetical protein
MLSADTLAAELTQVRRGLGLYHPDLDRRLGPGLRDVCRVAGADPADVRSLVVTRLRDAASALPPELSLAMLVALGVHPATRSRHQLQERVDWLADAIHRDARTARRRMDQAGRMLAEQLVAGREQRRRRPSSGWYIESAHTAFVLDGGPPTAYERRVIVAEQDGLDQLVLSRTVPPTGERGEPTVQILYGGRLSTREWDSATRMRLVLDLPAPLRAGDRHEYLLLVRAREPRPYYVFFPVLRVERFELRVRFDRASPPARVWRVDDVFHRDLDEPAVHGERLTPDRAMEVRVEFADLAPGHGYGVRWA